MNPIYSQLNKAGENQADTLTSFTHTKKHNPPTVKFRFYPTLIHLPSLTEKDRGYFIYFKIYMLYCLRKKMTFESFFKRNRTDPIKNRKKYWKRIVSHRQFPTLPQQRLHNEIYSRPYLGRRRPTVEAISACFQSRPFSSINNNSLHRGIERKNIDRINNDFYYYYYYFPVACVLPPRPIPFLFRRNEDVLLNDEHSSIALLK